MVEVVAAEARLVAAEADTVAIVVELAALVVMVPVTGGTDPDTGHSRRCTLRSHTHSYGMHAARLTGIAEHNARSAHTWAMRDRPMAAAVSEAEAALASGRVTVVRVPGLGCAAARMAQVAAARIS